MARSGQGRAWVRVGAGLSHNLVAVSVRPRALVGHGPKPGSQLGVVARGHGLQQLDAGDQDGRTAGSSVQVRCGVGTAGALPKNVGPFATPAAP
jgi:hypothetical protein